MIVGGAAVCRLGLLHRRIEQPTSFCPLHACRVFAHTVQHLAADGTLLAVLSGQPEPTSFAPTGIAILQSDGGGAPLLVAVADTVTNTVSFFKRTL